MFLKQFFFKFLKRVLEQSYVIEIEHFSIFANNGLDILHVAKNEKLFMIWRNDYTIKLHYLCLLIVRS